MARIKIKPFGMIIMTFTQLQTTWLSILRWQMVIFTVVHLNWGHLNKNLWGFISLLSSKKFKAKWLIKEEVFWQLIL